MDPSLIAILTSWSMPQLIPLFKEKQINTDNFLYYSDEYFFNMIPSELQMTYTFIKNRREYIQNYQKYFNPTLSNNVNKISTQVQSPTVTNSPVVHSLINCTSLGYQTLTSSSGNLDSMTEYENSSLTCHAVNMSMFDKNSSLDKYSKSELAHSSDMHMNMPNSQIDLSNDIQMQHALSPDLETQNYSITKISTNPIVIELFSFTNYYSQVEKNMRLFKLLEKDLPGMLILYNYSKDQPINTDRLCQIVVDDLLLRTVNDSLPLSTPLNVKGHLDQLAKEIEQLFPAERASLYYTPSFRLKSGERENARGLLQDYWSKVIRKELIKANLEIVKPVSQKPNNRKEDVLVIDSGALCKEYNSDNEQEICNLWTESYDYRQNIFFIQNDIDAIYDKILVLRSEILGRLIENDFTRLYSTYTIQSKPYFPNGGIVRERLKNLWPSTARHLIEYFVDQENEAEIKKQQKNERKRRRLDPGRAKKSKEKKKAPVGFVSKYKTDNQGHTEVLAFTLIHAFLNYTPHAHPIAKIDEDTLTSDEENETGSVQENEKELVTNNPNNTESTKIAYSKANIISSFVRHMQNEPPEGIENYIKREDQEWNPSHPYVLVLGPLNNIKKSFFVFKHYVYPCTSPTAAVDLSFKWFFVLNQKYPHIVQHIYSFLQVYIYELFDSNKKKPVALTKIHRQVKLLKKDDSQAVQTTQTVQTAAKSANIENITDVAEG